MVVGNSRIHRIMLKNVGTGTIPYLKIDNVKNLDKPAGHYPKSAYLYNGPGSGAAFGKPTYPFNLVKDGSGSGSYAGQASGTYEYDCYDMVTRPPEGYQGDLSANPPTSSLSGLGQNESCALTVMSRVDYLERLGSGAYTAMGEDTRMNITSWIILRISGSYSFSKNRCCHLPILRWRRGAWLGYGQSCGPQLLEQFGLLSRPLA